MALYTKKGDSVPPGFVPLSASKAADLQLNLIGTISKPRECLAIKYGGLLSGITTGLSSTYIHHFFRLYTGVAAVQRFNTFCAIPAFASLATYGLHNWLVRDVIIINKWSCSACYEMRSACIQSFFGVIYPIFSAAFSSFALGRRIRLPAIPPLNSRPIWEYFLNSLQPMKKTFTVFLLLHFLYGNFIAYEINRENDGFNKQFNNLVSDYHVNALQEKPEKIS